MDNDEKHRFVVFYLTENTSHHQMTSYLKQYLKKVNICTSLPTQSFNVLAKVIKKRHILEHFVEVA